MLGLNGAINISFETSAQTRNSIVGLTCLVIAIIAPVVTLWFLKMKFERFQDKKFKRKFSTLVNKLNLSNKAAIYYTLIFQLRRLVLAVAIVMVKDVPVAQIAIVLISSILVLSYFLTNKPLESPILNRLEFFNEFTLSFILCITPCFTSYAPEEIEGD